MTLRIEQGFKYKGDDWWKWWIWIDGPQEELDQIDHVTYILHPTFPNPVREIQNRHSQFLLESSGWGEFLIRANVMYKNGRKIPLKHFLKLEYKKEDD